MNYLYAAMLMVLVISGSIPVLMAYRFSRYIVNYDIPANAIQEDSTCRKQESSRLSA
jgi:hypothetical protein